MEEVEEVKDEEEDAIASQSMDDMTLQSLLDPLAELRDMLDPDHEGGGGRRFQARRGWGEY